MVYQTKRKQQLRELLPTPEEATQFSMHSDVLLGHRALQLSRAQSQSQSSQLDQEDDRTDDLCSSTCKRSISVGEGQLLRLSAGKLTRLKFASLMMLQKKVHRRTLDTFSADSSFAAPTTKMAPSLLRTVRATCRAIGGSQH